VTAVAELAGVVKRYPGQPPVEAIRGIDLRIDAGDLVAVAGPSGSGKSTLLRAITHLETADAGTLAIAGTPILADGVYADPATLRTALLKLGLVFQDFNLFPHFSVLRNVTEAQVRVLRRGKAEAREVARALLAKMGLADKAAAYPGELSGGQKQRVAIARALSMEPKVLLFDEPTSALDPTLVGEVLKVMAELAHEGSTMIVVTHEMAFAREAADRVYFIEEGRFIEAGPPEKVLDAPQDPRTQQFLHRLLEKV